MARIGRTGPGRPMVATGPREFRLLKHENPVGNLQGEGQPDASDVLDPWCITFNNVDLRPYGGEPGGIVVIPDDFLGFDTALTGGDAVDERNRSWLNPDDWRDKEAAQVAWRWPMIYELLQATELHPRLVPFRGRDPWTGFAVLEKPNGPNLVQFLDKYKHALYADSDRLLSKYLPLAYQWALQLLSALAFLHRHYVSIADIEGDCCWLSEPTLSLTITGFSAAVVREPPVWEPLGRVRYNGAPTRWMSYHPLNSLEDKDATPISDLSVWGCFIFQIMTGSWPGEANDASATGPIVRQGMSNFPFMPRLTDGHLRNIIKRVWDGDFVDTESLHQELIMEIRRHGWETTGHYNDELVGFSAADLLAENL